MSMDSAVSDQRRPMKSVEIDPAIQADPALLDLVRRATELLERDILGSGWKDRVLVSWRLFGHNLDSAMLRLQIDDEDDYIETDFSPADLTNQDYVERWMRRMWGDLLQMRSHKLLEARRDSIPSDRYLDGPDALDRIIDSVADYSEREGHEPKSLKLPIRYATALMKLGPNYWGDFYRQIRESGLRAFDGQFLLGMKVELVPGVDAELQVA
jgi:hypothetical protein